MLYRYWYYLGEHLVNFVNDGKKKAKQEKKGFKQLQWLRAQNTDVQSTDVYLFKMSHYIKQTLIKVTLRQIYKSERMTEKKLSANIKTQAL